MKILLTRPMDFSNNNALNIEYTDFKTFDAKRIVSMPFLRELILRDDYNLIVLTSPPTIEMLNKLNLDIPVACLSPFSAKKINNTNILYLTKPPYTGAELAQYITNKLPNKSNRMLVLNGKKAREELFNILDDYYDYVKRMAVYERIMPEYTLDKIREQLNQNFDVLVFTCNTAIENYLKYCELIHITPLLNAYIVVPSVRVKQFAEQNHFTNIKTANSIDEQDILNEIVALYENQA